MKTKIFHITKKRNFILWSEEEDNLLREQLKIKRRNNWKFIAQKLKNKSISQIYLRVKIIDPKLKKGKFSKEEDEKLTRLVEIFGNSWSLFSKLFKNRNSKQLRIRYTNHLRVDIAKNKFNAEEDEKILSLFKIHGNQWSYYKDLLPNRAFNKIKYRCKSLLNKNINHKKKFKEGSQIENDLKEKGSQKYDFFTESLKKNEKFRNFMGSCDSEGRV